MFVASVTLRPSANVVRWTLTSTRSLTAWPAPPSLGRVENATPALLNLHCPARPESAVVATPVELFARDPQGRLTLGSPLMPMTSHNSPLSITRAPGGEKRVLIAAAVGGFGGLLLFLDLSLHAFRPLGSGYYFVALLMAFCMPGVPIAYWLRGAVAPGWRRILGILGTAVVVLGAAAWVAAFLMLINQPDKRFVQHLTPGGSALMALGMILFGAAVATSRRFKMPVALLPLLVGLYFPLQLVAQLAFFLNGKDGSPGPNGIVLGAWGLVWVLAAAASVMAPERSD